MKLRYVMGLAFVGGLLMAAAPRPISEVQLFQFLNGETRRWSMPDGGASGTYGSGVQCLTIPNTVNVIKVVPSAAIHICFPPDAGWDGGCSTSPTDINYGDPIKADSSAYVTLQQSTDRVCTVPATGSANVPFFQVK